MRSYANYESLTREGNWKTQIMEIREGRVISSGPRPPSLYANFLREEMWRGKMIAGEQGEAGSCFSGCDVIICKLGPLHPRRLSMLENTHYGNQFDERLNSFTGLMRT
jgi:hypothetical protein